MIHEFLCYVLLSIALVAEIPNTPTATVSVTITKLQEVIRANKNLDDKELEKKIEDILRPVFALDEMSRRCTGSHWSNFTDLQKALFTDVFSKLLLRTYIKRLKTIDTVEIKFIKEIRNNNKAEVVTTVIDKNDVVEIKYKLLLRDSWQVYDISVQNIGLVTTYRSEFAAIIRKEGVDGLILKLIEKLDDK